MNVDLKGFKRNCGHQIMGDFIFHKLMFERDTRVLVNYAIEQGYETIKDVPDEIADKCCDASNHELDKYNDTPDFYTLEEIESALNRVHNNYCVDWDVDDIMNKLKEEL